MNILVVCHYGLYQDLSFSFVHNQVKQYAALGHRVRVIIPNGIGKTGRNGGRFGKGMTVSKIDGVELYDVRYLTLSSYGEKDFNQKSAIAAIRLHEKQILERFSPDVIHAHTLGFDSGIGAWLKKRLDCPLVVTTHGSDTNVPLDNGQGAFLKQCCDQADAVVAVSNQLKERLAACGTKTPLYAIHNGFVPRPVPEGIERKSCSIIQVGHMVPSKRVDVTIRAFAELRKTYPDMTLTIVGQGPLREDLEQLCLQLDVADAVQFTGQIPNEQVFARMCASGFYVMASKPEGFGIVYLEAMAAGCVTIGSEDQGIADIIKHGINGFLVPVDAPERIVKVVDQCLRDQQWADTVANEGRALANGMTWTKNAQNNLALFDQLTTSKQKQ